MIDKRFVYALKAIIALRDATEPISSTTLTTALGLPSSNAAQTLFRLSEKGLVRGRVGIHGGYMVPESVRDMDAAAIWFKLYGHKENYKWAHKAVIRLWANKPPEFALREITAEKDEQ